MYAGSAAGLEIERLWCAIARSVEAINRAQASQNKVAV
jgi:hypothetical protein